MRFCIFLHSISCFIPITLCVRIWNCKCKNENRVQQNWDIHSVSIFNVVLMQHTLLSTFSIDSLFHTKRPIKWICLIDQRYDFRKSTAFTPTSCTGFEVDGWMPPTWSILNQLLARTLHVVVPECMYSYIILWYQTKYG